MMSKSDVEKFKDRIESEARAACRITNNDLVCKDCLYAMDDKEIYGNTYRCRCYSMKPNSVLRGGSCTRYSHI